MNRLHREGVWILVGLGLWGCLHLAWPRMVGKAMNELSLLRRLETALPDSTRLESHLQRLLTDSVALSTLEGQAWDRAVTAGEPQARAVEEVLKATAGTVWNLERIQPSRTGQTLLVNLTVNSDFANLCSGLQGLSRSPRSVQLRGLSLRQSGERVQMNADLLLLSRSPTP